jgi:hypothetical protein
MGRKKIENRNIRNLQKTGGGATYMVTLPIEIIRDLGWKSKQKLQINKHGEGILIRDWKDDS